MNCITFFSFPVSCSLLTLSLVVQLKKLPNTSWRTRTQNTITHPLSSDRTERCCVVRQLSDSFDRYTDNHHEQPIRGDREKRLDAPNLPRRHPGELSKNRLNNEKF